MKVTNSQVSFHPLLEPRRHTPCKSQESSSERRHRRAPTRWHPQAVDAGNVLREGSASHTPLLTASAEVDDILRKQGVQLVVLHQRVLELLQHLENEGELLLLRRSSGKAKTCISVSEHCY